jgi:hypothetical protein
MSDETADARDYARYMDDVPHYLRPSVKALRRFGTVRVKGETTLWDVSLVEKLWHAKEAPDA